MKIKRIEELSKTEGQEIQHFIKQTEATNGFVYKIDSAAFEENNEKVQHLLGLSENELVCYGVISQYDPTEIEVTLVVPSDKEIIAEFSKELLEEVAKRQCEKLLLIIEEKDTLLKEMVLAQDFALEFSEWGMLRDNTDFPEVGVLNIQKAQAEEALEIAQLWNPSASLADATMTEADLAKTFIIKEDNVIASMRIDEAEERYAIYALVVHPDYRGKGLGRQFLSTTLQRFSDKPFYLEVESTNANAYHLYQSVGFETIAKFEYYVKKA